MLTIEAHTSHVEKKEKEGKYYRREMSRGDFRRSLSLTCKVDDAKARASFADGVLELKLPKSGPSGGTRVKVD